MLPHHAIQQYPPFISVSHVICAKCRYKNKLYKYINEYFNICFIIYVCISTATYKIIETEYDEYALIYRCIREWPNGGCARQDRNVMIMSRKRTLESRVIKRLLEIMVAALGMDARMMHYTKRTGMSLSLLIVYACKTSIYRRHITLTESPTIQNICKKLMLLEHFFSCYHF